MPSWRLRTPSWQPPLLTLTRLLTSHCKIWPHCFPPSLCLANCVVKYSVFSLNSCKPSHMTLYPLNTRVKRLNIDLRLSTCVPLETTTTVKPLSAPLFPPSINTDLIPAAPGNRRPGRNVKSSTSHNGKKITGLLLHFVFPAAATSCRSLCWAQPAVTVTTEESSTGVSSCWWVTPGDSSATPFLLELWLVNVVCWC